MTQTTTQQLAPRKTTTKYAGLLLKCAQCAPVLLATLTVTPFALAGDYYQSWGDLTSDTNYSEGTDWGRRMYDVVGNPEALVVALHGGEIELGTTELALDVAGIYTSMPYDYRLYVFEDKINNSSGCNGPDDDDDRRFHITAPSFDDPELYWRAGTANKIVTLHGMGDEVNEVVYIGGRSDELRDEMEIALNNAGFDTCKLTYDSVADDYTYDADPNCPAPISGLSGRSRLNPANVGRNHAGVQLEISKALRMRLFDAYDDGDNYYCVGRHAYSKTGDYWDFVDAIKAGLANADSHPEGDTSTACEFYLSQFASNGFTDAISCGGSGTPMLFGDEVFYLNQGSYLYDLLLDDMKIHLVGAPNGAAAGYSYAVDVVFDATNGFRKETVDISDLGIVPGAYYVTIENTGGGDVHPYRSGQSWLTGHWIRP